MTTEDTVRATGVKEWLHLMRDHNCGENEFLVFDDPRNLIVGYRCEGCGVVFDIKHLDLKNLTGMTAMQVDMFKSSLRDQKGRTNLAEIASMVVMPPPPVPEPDPLKVMIVPNPDCAQFAHKEPDECPQIADTEPDKPEAEKLEDVLKDLQEQAVQRERKEFNGIVPNRLERFRAALNKHFAWTFHNLIAHPLSEVVHLVGFSKFSVWIHDASTPPDH